jgi:hypothetical protein
MNNQYPADGRVMGSHDDDAPVVGLPPLPSEPVASSDRLDAFQEYLDAMSDDVLDKATVELRSSINAAHAQFALQVRELERRDVPRLDHGLTMTGWLKKYCHMSGAEASGTVKTARSMAHMPTVATNALQGLVPPRSVQLLAQASARHSRAFQDHETVFGDASTFLSVTDLRKVISHWEQQVAYPEVLRDTERRERLRSLYLAEIMEGMGDIRGTLTPELFHLFTTAIDAKVNPTFVDRDDRRTPAQRRADALGDICSFYLDHNTDLVTSAGEKPHVTITLDYDTLKGRIDRLPEISGAPVTPETMRRITCDAGIIPMVLGSDSEALDVGRKTRTIPSALRRALEQRDGSCTWQGCGAPVSWCDAHHIIHWVSGGETNLTNTKLLCRTHHTATHNNERSPPEP